MRYKSATALVTFKPCPRCGGTGQVPCDGLERHRAIREKWAQSLDMKPVLCQVPAEFNLQKLEYATLPGVAIESNSGGYAGVQVYVAITDRRPAPYSLNGVHLWNWEEFHGKYLWSSYFHYDDRDRVVLLKGWPEALLEMKPLLLASLTFFLF